MTMVSGVVEAKASTGKSIKVDGVWYGAYNAASLSAVNVGDAVSFEFAKSANGIYNNIKGKVNGATSSVNPATGAVTTTAARSASKPLPVELDRDRTIIRQNALTNAREAVTYNDVLFSSKDEASFIASIIRVAREFEAYTSGDGDIEAAKNGLNSTEN